MADSDDDFLKRWSRRKRGQTLEQDPVPAAPAPAAEAAGDAMAAEAGGDLVPSEEEAARRQALIEQLPDIETLDDSSDFTAFLQDGVPEELKRRALRRLWRLNPVFANLDGLNDYDDDFTDAAMVVKGMKTIYQVGKGMVMPDEEEPDEAALAEAPDAIDAAEPEPESATADQESEPAADPALPAGTSDQPTEAALDDRGGTEVSADAPAEPKRSAAARRRWQRFDS